MTDYIKQLESKVKECKNTNTIFDTRKYVLLEDAKEVLKQVLNIPDVGYFVICKDSRGVAFLTQNKIYKIIADDRDYYRVIDDDNYENTFKKIRFKKIEKQLP